MSEVSDIAKKIYELRNQKDNLSDSLKDLQSKLDQAENELVEALQHSGLSRVDVDGVGSFTLAVRKFFKVVDREALHHFLQENDSTDILSVNHNTLNAYIKEQKSKNGEDFEIPGTSFIAETQIRMRRA